uniref:Uncharacterized protein n=1 Tax=Sphaerodactylus townsendi TaxID=933632 RepID=A0ACB8E6Z1_9SAUR
MEPLHNGFSSSCLLRVLLTSGSDCEEINGGSNDEDGGVGECSRGSCPGEGESGPFPHQDCRSRQITEVGSDWGRAYKYTYLQDRKCGESTKPEKELPVKSLKLYLGVKKKVKPPTNWGLTLSSEKNHWYLCCDGRDSQLEWLSSLFIAQHSSIWPPHGKIRKQSTRKNPRIGGLSLIPIQHERSPPKTKVNNLENSKLDAEGELAEDKKGVKHRVPLITHCLERKEEKAQSCERKHRSMISLEGTGEDIAHLHQDPHMESQSPKPNENKGDQMPLDSDKQLLANVIQELNTILQKHKSSHKET